MLPQTNARPRTRASSIGEFLPIGLVFVAVSLVFSDRSAFDDVGEMDWAP